MLDKSTCAFFRKLNENISKYDSSCIESTLQDESTDFKDFKDWDGQIVFLEPKENIFLKNDVFLSASFTATFLWPSLLDGLEIFGITKPVRNENSFILITLFDGG